MANAVCYKIKTTEKGRGKKVCDKFLAYYAYKPLEEVQADVDRLNREKPDRIFFSGEKIDWDRIEYFFVHQQPEMY